LDGSDIFGKKDMIGVIRKLFRRNKNGLTITPDIYIVSFPKAGRTWLKFILAKIISDRFQVPFDIKIQLTTHRHGLPVIKFTHDISEPRLGTRCEDWRFDQSRYEGKKVIILTRELKDLMVSWYFNCTKRASEAFAGDIHTFVRDGQVGVQAPITFYKIWENNISTSSASLIISYEALKADAFQVIRNVVDFCGLNGVTDDMIQSALEYSSFENMKKMESLGEVIKARNAEDSSTFKVRKGIVGGFAEYLDDTDVDFINLSAAAANCPLIYSDACLGENIGNGSNDKPG
jgi:hypothetical protein